MVRPDPLVNYEKKTVNAWWPQMPKPGNFGDILTPWLIDKMCGFKAIHQAKPFKNDTLLAIGSIVGMANERTTVWGSGVINASAKPDNRASYRAVRGPITRSLAAGNQILCPAVYGDPALLMPRYYKPTNVSKKYEFGFFAHYVDTDLVSSWYSGDSRIKVINPLNNDPTKVVDDVLSCKRIISSSLHGIIISHAYGIPATWVQHSNKLTGDGIKFLDYFESVNIKLDVIDFTERLPVEELGKFRFVSEIAFDPLPLMKAFPILPEG